jgi:hypothetical protein
MDNRRPLWPWLVTGIVLLPALYVASLFPIAWCAHRNLIPETEATEEAFYVYAWPWIFVNEHAPEPVVGLMDAYIDWTEP